MFGKAFFIILIGLAVISLLLSFIGGGSLFLLIGVLLLVSGALVYKIFDINLKGY
ncbi:hypothetical protein ACT4X9_00380 [Acinetobacter baumannii]